MNVLGNKKKCLMTQLQSVLRARALCQDRLELLEDEIQRIGAELRSIELTETIENEVNK